MDLDKNFRMEVSVPDNIMAVEAVRFAFVPPDGFESERNWFKPRYASAIFETDEVIFGYNMVDIRILLSACDLKINIDYDFEMKAPSGSRGTCDDIGKFMKKCLPEDSLVTHDFKNAVHDQWDFKPYGELIYSYTSEEDGKKKSFEIYHVAKPNESFLAYLKRIQYCALWFIEGLSFTDTNDECWHYFVLFEKVTNNGRVYYASMGYCSVYDFYAYPDGIRSRIGQFFIFPPFQQQGHGAKFLQSVLNAVRSEPRVLEITVEDPVNEFLKLRDFIDAKNCSGLPLFQPENLKGGFTDDMALEALKKLKIHCKQARRVYEILRLGCTNMFDKNEFKAYRLDVKRNIMKIYNIEQDDLEGVQANLDMTVENSLIKKDRNERYKVLQEAFERLMQDYKPVVDRLKKMESLPPAIFFGGSS
ncbi:Histone acetyltransferase type B catalytic subunit [Trichinella nativa]|uniref:Histone acetyltransferase type B catalytic subunit n=1 Tax=Trichinella nativa TaxID=6335 RepID=A0A0V1LTQ3_9BILA|nr:Histone acetyltransferase type B catalytic subunit [Trichinella nativa]